MQRFIWNGLPKWNGLFLYISYSDWMGEEKLRSLRNAENWNQFQINVQNPRPNRSLFSLNHIHYDIDFLQWYWALSETKGFPQRTKFEMFIHQKTRLFYYKNVNKFIDNSEENVQLFIFFFVVSSNLCPKTATCIYKELLASPYTSFEVPTSN